MWWCDDDHSDIDDDDDGGGGGLLAFLSYNSEVHAMLGGEKAVIVVVSMKMTTTTMVVVVVVVVMMMMLMMMMMTMGSPGVLSQCTFPAALVGKTMISNSAGVLVFTDSNVTFQEGLRGCDAANTCPPANFTFTCTQTQGDQYFLR